MGKYSLKLGLRRDKKRQRHASRMKTAQARGRRKTLKRSRLTEQKKKEAEEGGPAYKPGGF